MLKRFLSMSGAVLLPVVLLALVGCSPAAVTLRGTAAALERALSIVLWETLAWTLHGLPGVEVKTHWIARGATCGGKGHRRRGNLVRDRAE